MGRDTAGWHPWGKHEAHHRANGDGLRVALRVESRGRTTPSPSLMLGSSVARLRPDCRSVPAVRSSCPPALTPEVVSMSNDTTHPRVRANRRLSAPFSRATSSPTANTSVPKHSTCGGMPAFAAPYTNSGKVTEGPATNEVIT
jgi:hypothetical protein